MDIRKRRLLIVVVHSHEIPDTFTFFCHVWKQNTLSTFLMINNVKQKIEHLEQSYDDRFSASILPGEETSDTSSGHIPATEDVAPPPARRPVPPQHIPPPQVGIPSSRIPSCPVCSPVTLHTPLRWPFVARPTRFLLDLWPWWPCCCYSCHHGNNAGHEHVTIAETDRDSKKKKIKDWETTTQVCGEFEYVEFL